MKGHSSQHQPNDLQEAKIKSFLELLTRPVYISFTLGTASKLIYPIAGLGSTLAPFPACPRLYLPPFFNPRATPQT